MNQMTLELVGKSGSHSYGTNTPESDLDSMGIVIPFPAKEYYLGLNDFGNSGTIDVKTDVIDTHFYELVKFVQLALKFNPNVIPLLWLDRSDYIFISDVGEKLIQHRDMFTSLNVYQTFKGYAHAQRGRMRGDTTGQLGEKRKQLIRDFGYDTKFAFHTVRLLKSCKEFLENGQLIVKRPDALELLSIRNGKYSLDEIEGIISHLLVEVEEIWATSKLPKEPDFDGVHKLIIEILEERLETISNSYIIRSKSELFDWCNNPNRQF